MALSVYRRHRKNCPGNKSKAPRDHWKCSCQIWVQGRLWKSGEYLRESLQVATREAAFSLIRQWEIDGFRSVSAKITVQGAVQAYLDDCKARKLAHSTYDQIRQAMYRSKTADPNKERVTDITLMEFCHDHGIDHLEDVTREMLTKWRSSWRCATLTHRLRLGRVKAFFRFCVDHEWITKSPAEKISPPPAKKSTATLPFDTDEIERMHDALQERTVGVTKDYIRRTSALMRVLEYTGLRIGDAVGLDTTRLSGNKIILRRQEKTGTTVAVPIPAWLSAELRSLPTHDGSHWFWKSDQAKRLSAVNGYRKAIRGLGTPAKVKEVRPHRFRDTMAVRLLEQGVPVEYVSQLLGHSNPRITMEYYSPWVKRLQDRAEEAVTRVWDALKQNGPRIPPQPESVEK